MLYLPADVWFVVQVAPRSERRVASILEYKGYRSFAPTYVSRKRWSDRIKTLERPLFPGYVFVRAPETPTGGLISSTPGVTRILSFGGRPALVADDEIDAIQRVSASAEPLPTPYVHVGHKVEITKGPLAGIVGIVREIRNRACLVVSVELIAQSIYVVIDEHQIGPVISAAS